MDPELGALVNAELRSHGVDVVISTPIQRRLSREPDGRLLAEGEGVGRTVDLVLIVTGVRPDTELLTQPGAATGAGDAAVINQAMRTVLDSVIRRW